MSHSFTKLFPQAYRQKGENELSIGTDAGIPVYITEDGKVRSKGFIDDNDNLEFSTHSSKVVTTHDINPLVSVKSEVSSGEKSFIAIAPAFFDFQGIFKKLSGFFLSVSYRRFPFLKYLPKKLKRQIENYSQSYPFYLEYPREGNEKFPRPIIVGGWNKPYETPVMIYVGETLGVIADLLVIKTGCFNYVSLDGTGLPLVRSGIKEEKIIYVSPHEKVQISGYVTGQKNYQRKNSAGGNATFSGSAGVEGCVYLTGLSRLSSSAYTLNKGEFISGSSVYKKISSDLGSFSYATGNPDLTESLFYQSYSGYQNRFSTNLNWDGVIPSGVPFKIESWSFNGDLVGYEGSLFVVPQDEKDASFSAQKIGKGLSTESSEEALSLSFSDANKRAQNSFECGLIDKKLLLENSKYRKYTSFIKTVNKSNDEDSGTIYA